MLEIIEYQNITSSSSITALTNDVNRFINRGYQPFGSIQIVTSGPHNNYATYVQTLVKYKQPQIKELQ